MPCRAGKEIELLWQEYEQAQTPEARLVKDFDKVGQSHRRGAGCVPWPSMVALPADACRRPAIHALQLEMILQAHEYECGQGMQLQEFFDSTAGKWRTELGQSWAEEIYKRRKATAAAQGKEG